MKHVKNNLNELLNKQQTISPQECLTTTTTTLIFLGSHNNYITVYDSTFDVSVFLHNPEW